MAHSCPFCDQACYCKGDWDDAFMPFEPAGGCIHYLEPMCDGNEDNDNDEDFYDDWDDDDHPLNPPVNKLP
jgi:hypothetical protein